MRNMRLVIRDAMMIPGWMTEPELWWLANKAETIDWIVEVGAWNGRTTKVLAAASPGVVTVVDNWSDVPDQATGKPLDGQDAKEMFYINLSKELEVDKVVVCEGDSVQVAENLPRGKYGLVFIDADHLHLLRDLEAYEPLVRPKGWLAGHDFVWPEVRRDLGIFFVQLPEVYSNIWYVRREARGHGSTGYTRQNLSSL